MGNLCKDTEAETDARQQVNTAKGEAVTAIAERIDIDEVEREMLSMPQIDCPLVHHFGGGIYIREGFIAAGTYIIGHAHKKETMNILLKGKMVVVVNGQAKIIEGPYIFVSDPGRKFGYAIEDCIFQNIHPTEKTDLVEIEDEFIEKSVGWDEARIGRENLVAIENAVSKLFEEAA